MSLTSRKRRAGARLPLPFDCCCDDERCWWAIVGVRPALLPADDMLVLPYMACTPSLGTAELKRLAPEVPTMDLRAPPPSPTAIGQLPCCPRLMLGLRDSMSKPSGPPLAHIVVAVAAA